jgi:hypothetical protein
VQEAASRVTNRLLRVVTRCATRVEFLATFDRFVDETSVFVATHQPRPLGAKLPFAIALRDGEAVLRGEGEVIESQVDTAGPLRRPGMRLRLLRLDGPSQEVHRELLHRKRHPTGTLTGIPPLRPLPRAATGSAPPVPPPETRVRGSSYVVPANPFGEIPPEALEYFIECTLYEEATVQPPAAEEQEPPEALPAPAPEAASSSVANGAATAAATPPLPTTPPRGVTVAASQRTGWLAVLGGIIGAGVGLAGGYALWGPAQAPSIRVAHAPAMAAAPPPQVEPLPAASPEPVEPAVAEPAPAGPAAAEAAVEPAAVEPAAAEPAAVEPAAAEPAVEKAAVVEPEPPTETAPVTPEPATPSPPVVVAAAIAPLDPRAPPCRLRVVTEPPDAPVRLRGSRTRRTPFETSLPCGEVSLSIEHPRYQRVERTVILSPGEPELLNERLVRPRGVLSLSSSPSGASFVVNGDSAGRAPTRAPVPGFTFVTVRARLEGYAPWTQRVYVRGTQASLVADLQPAGSRATTLPPRVLGKSSTTTPATATPKRKRTRGPDL